MYVPGFAESATFTLNVAVADDPPLMSLTNCGSVLTVNGASPLFSATVASFAVFGWSSGGIDGTAILTIFRPLLDTMTVTGVSSPGANSFVPAIVAERSGFP